MLTPPVAAASDGSARLDTADADDATDRAARAQAAVPRATVARWQRDERRAAWDQAHAAQEADPDAAAFLRAALRADADALAPGDDAAAQRRTPQTTPPYDPMRHIARVVRFYGLSHREVLGMWWPTFLGYAQQADMMLQEERDSYRDGLRERGETPRTRDAQATGYTPAPWE